ncbi:MAG TPA: thiamine-phosphate kinase [Candidatus Tumulicola sp.]|nr:thiamine-phosphate kinase [Candidatus Tumulicola sp.]
MRALKREALTEDDLVAAIAGALGESPRSLRVGIGDDAAVWKTKASHLSLVTTDMLVDGVHFRLHETSPQALGHKALAENLSDIAAMGGRPCVAVIALGITADVDEAWAREFYTGMAGLGRRTGCAIAGGDIVRAPVLTIAPTIVGEVRRSNLRTRAGARAGDVIVVTGPLGLAAAALRVSDARKTDTLRAESRALLMRAYFTPEPRLREGRFLGSRRAVHAMMDISDGLSTDVARMARASALDAHVDAASLSVHPAVAEAARAAGVDARSLTLDGGDDYELLVAVETRAYPHVARSFEAKFGRPLCAVGRFESGAGNVWLLDGDRREPLPRGGYDHFKKL